MKKARMIDIAREAGVGTATVERVLNARGNVAPATVEKVIVAARRLDYDGRLPELHHGTVRIEVIMMRPDTPFFTRLNKAFARIAAALDRAVIVQRTFLDEANPTTIAEHIAHPASRRSGLIIVAPDDPLVRMALLAAQAAGLPIVHIVSRIGDIGALPFVGIDNHAVGRTAAFYLSRMAGERPGRFIALSHSAVYRAHRERIAGFSSYLAEHADPRHPFDLVLFGLDDPRRSEKLLEEAFAATPDIAGIYNAGGGNTGVVAVLNRQGRGQRVLWIGHELTETTRASLTSGLMDLTFDQAPEVQARRSLDLILRKVGITDVEVSSDPVQFLTITRENL